MHKCCVNPLLLKKGEGEFVAIFDKIQNNLLRQWEVEAAVDLSVLAGLDPSGVHLRNCFMQAEVSWLRVLPWSL